MHAGESLWNLYGLLTGLERRFGSDPSILKALAGARNDLKVIGDLIMVPPPSDAEVAPRIPQFDKSAVPQLPAKQEDRPAPSITKKGMTALGQEAKDLCIDILDDIDDMPERAGEFSESIREKAKSMLERIEKYGDATDKMVTALENMRHGQLKWLDRV